MNEPVPVVPGDKLVTRLRELQTQGKQNAILHGQGVFVTTTPQGTIIEAVPVTGEASEAQEFIPRLG